MDEHDGSPRLGTPPQWARGQGRALASSRLCCKNKGQKGFYLQTWRRKASVSQDWGPWRAVGFGKEKGASLQPPRDVSLTPPLSPLCPTTWLIRAEPSY